MALVLSLQKCTIPSPCSTPQSGLRKLGHTAKEKLSLYPFKLVFNLFDQSLSTRSNKCRVCYCDDALANLACIAHLENLDTADL